MQPNPVSRTARMHGHQGPTFRQIGGCNYMKVLSLTRMGTHTHQNTTLIQSFSAYATFKDWKGPNNGAMKTYYPYTCVCTCTCTQLSHFFRLIFSYVTGFEKRGHFAHFPNFGFKMLISLEPYQLWTSNLVWIYILSSSYYIRCKSRAPPTSGIGGASGRVDRVRKSPFYAPLWQLTARVRRLAQGSNVGSVKQKVQTANQIWSPRLSLPWNGGKLKSGKNRVLRKVPPFLKSGHIYIYMYIVP